MLGSLTSDQCRHLLTINHVGRIAFSQRSKPTIIPITYVFDGKSIYCRSYEGTKIRVMRKNPSVCFQMDFISSLTNWYSVLAWGVYEEMGTPSELRYVDKLFAERLSVFTLGETVNLGREFDNRPQIVEKRLKPVTWRIKVDEFNGRYEKN